jgi:hypothetical protein
MAKPLTSVTRYYRADTPDVREAWKIYAGECDQLFDQAKAMAALFPGAIPVYTGGIHGKNFYGLRFDPPAPLDIWTTPDREGRTQQPRGNSRKVTGPDKADRVAEWARVRALYSEAKPTIRPNLDPVYRELGTNWGSLLFAGFGMSEKDGVLYMATGAELGVPCVEITGGEFQERSGG